MAKKDPALSADQCVSALRGGIVRHYGSHAIILEDDLKCPELFFAGDVVDPAMLDCQDCFSTDAMERLYCFFLTAEKTYEPLTFTPDFSGFGLIVHPYQLYSLRMFKDFFDRSTFICGPQRAVAIYANMMIFADDKIPHPKLKDGPADELNIRIAHFFGKQAGTPDGVRVGHFVSWASSPL